VFRARARRLLLHVIPGSDSGKGRCPRRGSRRTRSCQGGMAVMLVTRPVPLQPSGPRPPRAFPVRYLAAATDARRVT
jgi:hypothetical protein